MVPAFVSTTIPNLKGPDKAARAAAVAGEGGKAAHDALAAETAALHAVETVALGLNPAPARLTVAAWNLERCKYLPPTTALLQRTGAQVLLLTEMDLGMARSGNRHTTAEIGAALGMNHVFATEFVELGLGDAREQEWHKGEDNAEGLHGNSVLAPFELSAPCRVALDEGGRWFEGMGDQRRIGGRCAVGASIALPGGEVFVAAIHLESHSDPEDRAAQVSRLLRAMADKGIDGPAVIAGDFNTNTMPNDADPVDRQAPWFVEAKSEPLFARFAAAGFSWVEANTPEPTERQRPDGRPQPPFRRIDWVFIRGLTASNPKVWPAVDENGHAISDHELLTLDIALA